MTIETLESVVHGVRNVVGKGGAVATGLMALCAGRAVDRFVLLLLSQGGSAAKTAGEDEGGRENPDVCSGADDVRGVWA
jgi:hypothetical protein